MFKVKINATDEAEVMTISSMRKRSYAHSKLIKKVDDCLVEIFADPVSYAPLATSTETQTPQAQIHNLVGTAQIQCSMKPLNLKHISQLLPNCSYDKQKFAAITIRLQHPYCTILLFTSGKMVLTGCKTFLQCVLATHRVVNFLRCGMPSCKFVLINVRIQNIVGNVDLNLQTSHKMDLDAIFRENTIFTTYQRTMFPGLIYRPNASPVVLLIFQSGKIVITGGKSTHDIHMGWKMLWPFVRRYIVANSTVPKVEL